MHNLVIENETSYLPNILKYPIHEHQQQLSALRSNPKVKIVDSIEYQLRELIKINNCGKPLSEAEQEAQKQTLLNGQPIAEYGVWVYYPWLDSLVHLLDEKDFIAVRTNRNKLKITQEEQDLLATKKIGIIGLSVGQSVAITMAIERTCGELRLADFDTLDLSNLNRLRAGVHHIGVPKVIIAAREIAEIDPYLKVSIYKDGITDANMDEFLGTGKTKLDILVEVCDGVDIKIKSRKAARDKQIPVVMDTNDKGMIDIERFDLEPVRKLFHGLIDETINISTLTPEQRIQFLMKMVSFENTSDRLKASMNEIGKTISTWPQLASSVMLGGAATTDTCRRILLNQHTKSGRFYIDFEKIIA
jgi:hypothetical protein